MKAWRVIHSLGKTFVANSWHSSAFEIDVCCSSRLFGGFVINNMEGDSSECNIKVVCRFRPQSQSEVNSGGSLMTKYPSKSNDTTVFGVWQIPFSDFDVIFCVVYNPLSGILFLQNRVYTFDHVLRPTATQEEVYMISAKPIVKGLFWPA